MSKKIVPEDTTIKKIKISIILFILFSSIPSSYTKGKRARKNTLKAIKKNVRIYQNFFKDRYNEILKESDNIMNSVHNQMIEEFGEDANFIDPGIILQFLKFKRLGLIEEIEIKDDWINELIEVYGSSGVCWQSIKYTNKILNMLDKEL